MSKNDHRYTGREFLGLGDKYPDPGIPPAEADEITVSIRLDGIIKSMITVKKSDLLAAVIKTCN